jgi:hypothetical protein
MFAREIVKFGVPGSSKAIQSQYFVPYTKLMAFEPVKLYVRAPSVVWLIRSSEDVAILWYGAATASVVEAEYSITVLLALPVAETQKRPTAVDIVPLLAAV